MKKWEDGESPEIVLKVHEALISQLYKQSWVGLAGLFVVTLMVYIILRNIIPQWKLELWAVVIICLTVVRALAVVLYYMKSPSGNAVYLWAKLHVASVSIAGLMWGFPGIFLWPANSPVHQLVWPICIVSLAAAATATYSTWTLSYISYLTLSVIPISLRLLYETGISYKGLGFLGIFFAVVLAFTGRKMNRAYIQMLLASIRNQSLSSLLAAEMDKQEELNRELQVAHDQLHQLSLTDDLTGLWNRRFLKATIHEDLAQTLRHYYDIRHSSEKAVPQNIDIVFLMVDMDHFKKVNDTYGHSAGDLVLKEMRRLLTNSYRDMDSVIRWEINTVIRWGGEEFLVVARNAQRNNLAILAERIRKAVEIYHFNIGQEKPIKLTCSIGAAVFPFLPQFPEHLSWSNIVELADMCLYAAKRSGRNAWVGIVPTAAAVADDFKPDFLDHIPDFIRGGKLEVKTNLPNVSKIRWE